jgi:hypothetical protein
MNEPNDSHERAIAERARALFRDSLRGIDAETRSRLAAARAAAVDAADARRVWWQQPSRLVPIGGVAAALLALALIFKVPEPPVAPIETEALNDLEILLEGEDLELFEDLEFYTWLLEQPELLVPDAAGDGNG